MHAYRTFSIYLKALQLQDIAVWFNFIQILYLHKVGFLQLQVF